MKKNMLMLAEKVLATSQHLTFQSNSKRVIERTPNEDTKRCSRSIGEYSFFILLKFII